MDTAVTQLAGHQVEQGAAAGSAPGDTAKQGALREGFVLRLSRPIASIVTTSLKDAGESPTLTAPTSVLGNGAFLAAAQPRLGIEQATKAAREVLVGLDSVISPALAQNAPVLADSGLIGHRDVNLRHHTLRASASRRRAGCAPSNHRSLAISVTVLAGGK